MPLPPKDYLGLDEIESRWGIERRDTMYFLENELLEVSVHVIEHVIESGLVEDPADEQWIAVPEERGSYTGLLPLRSRDVVEIFRRGSARVRQFKAEYGAYCAVASPDKAITVRAGDLVVTQVERDRFERVHGLGPRGDAARATSRKISTPSKPFSQSNDYAEVRLNGHTFRLGRCQAEVVRILHEACTTDSPWCPGKVILHQAGSNCTKVADLFKAQLGWRQLILSNRRGLYRLNTGPSDVTG